MFLADFILEMLVFCIIRSPYNVNTWLAIQIRSA